MTSLSLLFKRYRAISTGLRFSMLFSRFRLVGFAISQTIRAIIPLPIGTMNNLNAVVNADIDRLALPAPIHGHISL